MSGRIFPVELYRFFLFPFLLLQFSALYDAYTVHRQYTGAPRNSSIHSFLLRIITGSDFLMPSKTEFEQSK